MQAHNSTMIKYDSLILHLQQQHYSIAMKIWQEKDLQQLVFENESLRKTLFKQVVSSRCFEIANEIFIRDPKLADGIAEVEKGIVISTNEIVNELQKKRPSTQRKLEDKLDSLFTKYPPESIKTDKKKCTQYLEIDVWTKREVLEMDTTDRNTFGLKRIAKTQDDIKNTKIKIDESKYTTQYSIWKRKRIEAFEKLEETSYQSFSNKKQRK